MSRDPHPQLTAAWLRLMFNLVAGPGGYLHFGFWRDLPRDPSRFADAQQAFTDLVVGLLRPAPGMAVLDVGAGVGGIARTLVGLGAEVTAVCPDPGHAAATRRATGGRARVLEQRFEALEDTATYDRILFSESFGFPAAALRDRGGASAVLDRCAERLAPGGEVLVVDFLPEADAAAMAAHERLRLAESEDITADVAFTIDAMQARFDQWIRPYHDLVMVALDLGDPPLAQAVAERLRSVPNQTVAALLAGRIDRSEDLTSRPYRVMRLELR